jgi:glycosyltransferase involved in cell wall biosynthesis
MTLVSVVIAVKNGAEHIGPAVRSVLDQTVRDLELLVVDDASTDGTADAAREAAGADERLHVISLPRNLGPSGARNAGFSRASGRWIAILDADDRFRPQRLERLLRAGNAASADMVCDDLLVHDVAAARPDTPMFGADMPSIIGAADFILGNLPDPDHPRRGYGFLKPIFRAEFLASAELCYDETMRFAEDYAFYVDCLLAGARWAAVPEPLYVYAVRSDSLTSNHGAADLERLCRVDERALEHPAAKADAALAAALRRHLLSSRKRERWALFIDQFRERRFGELPGTAAFSPRIAAHIGACCLREAVLRSRRLVGSFTGRLTGRGVAKPTDR